jgi:fluoroquinolone transport system permease protein
MKTTIQYDLKLIRKDPMLLVSMLTPILFYLIVAYIFPLIQQFVWQEWNYDISPYYEMTVIFFIFLIPMMLGMVYGYILLDERDGGIITALSVTPLGKSGYLKMRLLLPTLFSFLVCTAFYFLLAGNLSLSIWQVPLLQLVLSFTAPLMVLFLAAYASNKVEGIAISKGFGLLFVAILIDFFAPAPYNWLGAYSPFFWLERGFFAGSTSTFFLYTGISTAFYGTLIMILYRKFSKTT